MSDSIPLPRRHIKKRPQLLATAVADVPHPVRIRLLFQDEGRFGRINATWRCWAPQSVRPRMSHQVVCAALKAMPLPWRQLHFNSGREVINRQVVGMCRRMGIAHTRTRPFRSNNNARIENANRYAVRRACARTGA